MHPRPLPILIAFFLLAHRLSALEIAATILPPSCYGLPDGQIQLSPSGGLAPYAFLWQDGSKSPTLVAAAGQYAVTVTDANGASATAVFSLENPPALRADDTLGKPVSCIGAIDGEIGLSIAGGTAPYHFKWANGSLSTTLTGLAAGNYSLTVTDAHLCSLTATLAVGQPEALFAGATVALDTCEKSTGAVRLALLGGTAPYQIQWASGQNSATIDGLSPGIYAVTITDAHGCSVAIQESVGQFGRLPALDFFTDTITCAEPLAHLGLRSPEAGTAYFWENPRGETIAGESLSSHFSGKHRLSAINAFGCAANAIVEVLADTLRPRAVAAQKTLTVPCGQNMGLLDGSASSSGALFAANWRLETSGTVIFDTLAWLAEARAAGLFRLVLTNLRNGCRAADSTEVQFAQPIAGAEITVDSISCNGARDGQIQILSVSGGNPPFAYSFENQLFASDAQRGGLAAGEYLVEIRDAENCAWQTHVALLEPALFSVALTVSDTAVRQGEQLRVEAVFSPQNAAAAVLAWQPSALFSEAPTARAQVIFLPENTEIAVLAANENGCRAEASRSVRALRTAVFAPNAFQPGSAQNARFTIFAGEDVAAVRLLQVFDRWGNLLFEQRDFAPNDESAGWDGTVHGRPAPAGAHTFRAEIVYWNGEKAQLSGNLLLVR